MYAENGAFDNSCGYQIVKYFRAVLPRVDVSVLAHAFVVEAVLHRDVSRFVIPAQDSNAAWVFEFEAEKKLENFEGILSTVDEVAHEHIVSIRHLASFLEKLK